ncbi:MAG TPA: hypothetical protein VGG10_12355 [Rhizomicrobium sp.]
MGKNQGDAGATEVRLRGFHRGGRFAPLLVALAACWCDSSSAVTPRCAKPDASFKVFLSRFTDDKDFQRARLVLPLVARAGNYQTWDASVELWSLKKIGQMSDPLIYSRQDRKRLNLSQDIVELRPNRYAEVYQANAGEADDTRLLYRFRDLEGCWFLEEIDDRSL